MELAKTHPDQRGCVSSTGRLITDFGETRLREGETVTQAAARRYRAWQAGWLYEGYITPYFWLGADADNG